jgi:ribosome-associated protein
MEVERTLKGEGGRRYRRSGTPESRWITVDCLDVVIHLMSAEARAYYALESLWKDAIRLDES